MHSSPRPQLDATRCIPAQGRVLSRYSLRPDHGGLVIEAKENEINGLNAKIAELEQQLAAGAGDDVAVSAIKRLAVALTSVSTSGTSAT